MAPALVQSALAAPVTFILGATRVFLIWTTLVWFAAGTMLYVFQRRLLFMPNAVGVTPADVGLLGVNEETLVTPDNQRLIMWWSAPRPGAPVIVYFTGNGGNAANRAERIRLFQSAGFGALILNYRGYGGSTGEPSEAAFFNDGKLVVDYVVQKKSVPLDRIVLFGESLGTGVAVEVATQRAVGGVILDSPFTSIADVAQARYPLFPVRPLMWDQFDSLSRIKSVDAPLLVIHGDRDTVVPYRFGKELFDAAHEPKQLVTLHGLGHTAPLSAGGWAAIKPFVDRLSARG